MKRCNSFEHFRNSISFLKFNVVLSEILLLSEIGALNFSMISPKLVFTEERLFQIGKNLYHFYWPDDVTTNLDMFTRVGVNCSKFDCSTIICSTLLAGNQLLEWCRAIIKSCRADFSSNQILSRWSWPVYPLSLGTC